MPLARGTILLSDYFLLKMKHLIEIMAVATVLDPPKLWLAATVTLLFSAFGRLVRGVTNSGAVVGAMACFVLLTSTGWAGFAGLSTVFVVTWAATRFGYARKQAIGMAEARSGRTAAQVFANLGVAAICAALLRVEPRLSLKMAVGAALCEAAADTVSSEIGQAIGGAPRLVTTWQRVKPGSNGAMTLAGTLSGIAAAAVIGAIYGYFGQAPMHTAAVCMGAGVAGTIADSVLGATIESGGLAGNDVVNFLSTLIAAVIAIVLA